jgi:hypothetical protein
VRILVFDQRGEQMHDIALRPGWVEHLKFIDGDSLLVFARSYVARVVLQEGDIPGARADLRQEEGGSKSPAGVTPEASPAVLRSERSVHGGSETTSVAMNDITGRPAAEAASDHTPISVVARPEAEVPSSAGDGAWIYYLGVVTGLAVCAAAAWVHMRRRKAAG